MESDFPLLVGNLSAFQWGTIGVILAQTLDCITDTSLDIDGRVDYTIGSGSQDLGQLELSFEEST